MRHLLNDVPEIFNNIIGYSIFDLKGFHYHIEIVMKE
jgi:hypothetical protein